MERNSIPTDQASNNTQISFWDYLLLLLKWRRVIFFNIIAVGIVVGIISLIIPSWFIATTTILPPSKDTINVGGISSMLGGLGSLMGGGGGGGGFLLPAFVTPSDIYAAILESRTTIERIIQENNLEEQFDSEGELLRKKVASLTRIEVLKNGIISISFEAKDPVLAANVTNDYASILNDINKKINSEQAGNTRKFIGGRLEQTEKDLEIAENNMRSFQEKHGALDLTEQLKAQIQNAAELQSQLVLAEIELGVLRESMSSENTTVRKFQSRIQQIKKQLQNLEESEPDKESLFLTLPFSKAPELGLELIRLTRELKIQETLFELLKTQFEQAKIQEERDTPTIQILDVAKTPERRSRPLRAKMVLMGMLGSLLFSVLAIFVIEYFGQMKKNNRDTFDKFYTVVTLLRDDLNSLGKFIYGRRTRDTGVRDN